VSGDRLTRTRRPRFVQLRPGVPACLCVFALGWSVGAAPACGADDGARRGRGAIRQEHAEEAALTGLLYAYNKQNPRPAPVVPRSKPYRPDRQPSEALDLPQHHHKHNRSRGWWALIGLVALLVAGIAAWRYWRARWRFQLLDNHTLLPYDLPRPVRSESEAAAAAHRDPRQRPSAVRIISSLTLLVAVAVLSYQMGDRLLGSWYYVFPALTIPAILFPWLFPSRPPHSQARTAHRGLRRPWRARFRRGSDTSP
jgi:hypothetical protein